MSRSLNGLHSRWIPESGITPSEGKDTMRYMTVHMMMLRMVRSEVRQSSRYLDPGTGSMLLQVILGGVAGAAVAVKMFWHRILAILPSGSRNSDDTSASE